MTCLPKIDTLSHIARGQVTELTITKGQEQKI